MTCDTALHTDADLAAAVADEYGALADLLEASDPGGVGRALAVRGLAHPGGRGAHDDAGALRGPGLHGRAGSRRWRLHPPVEHGGGAGRRAARPALLADLRSEVLHGWQPPGGGMEGALTHCVIHGLDIIEAVPLARRLPDDHVARVLGIVAGPDAPNLFGVDLSGVALRADDLDWSCGLGGGGDGVGAGAGPRGVRPPAAAGPAGRRGGGSLHLGLDG